MKRIITILITFCTWLLSSCSECITLSSLLDEMIDRDMLTRFPKTTFTQKQISSYDRRSIAKGEPGWFANSDGSGYERLDTISGRIEKVMFEEKGPGVITRIWLTTWGKSGTMRFYLDGTTKPQIIIPAYDMKRFPLNIHEGLSLTHTHYVADMNDVGGNTFYLPIPYQKSCKITFEDPKEKVPRYYQINYRTYSKRTKIETFTLDNAKSLLSKINQVGEALLHPEEVAIEGKLSENYFDLKTNESKSISLPSGEKAIRKIQIQVSGFEKETYSDMMDSIILEGQFDGFKNIRVPIADFSGAGMGARKTNGWYLSADGNGKITSLFVMPYKKEAVITLKNTYSKNIKIKLSTIISDYNWDKNSMYFHVSHKFEKDILLDCKPNDNHVLDWNFITLKGKGVYVGDLLSLYNYSKAWYGEGDEKIYVDDETFPSHFGTGTEDYYNCSWAPVVPFLTPFGGAPQTDETSSHGYNSFLRTRNLDVIPFNSKLVFDIEMISWFPGTADYYTTTYWYGLQNAEDNANY